METNLNFEYLFSEVNQVVARIQSVLQTWLKMGGDEADRFRGLYISAQEIQSLVNSTLAEPKSKPSTLPEAEIPSYQSLLDISQQSSQKLVELAEQQQVQLRLLHLKNFFSLDDFEYKAFLVCLIPSLDLRYERIYGFLQDDVTKKQAGVDLILNVLNEETNGISHLQKLGYFSSAGTLVRYRLIRAINSSGYYQEPRLNQLFEVSPSVVTWLLGDYFPEENWLRFTSNEQLENEIQESPLLSELDIDWQKIVDHRPLLAFDGPDETSQEIAAKKIAAIFSMPLLKVDLRTIFDELGFSLPMLRLLIRDACLLEAIPYLQGWDRLLDKDGFVSQDILDEMANFAGIFILGSALPWRVPYHDGNKLVFCMHFPLPDSTERLKIWEQMLGPNSGISPETIRYIAGQFRLTAGQIGNAFFRVQNSMIQSGKPFSEEDLYQAARQQSSHHLGKLAQKIDSRYSWDDIVLPPEELSALADILSTVRYRTLVLEEWGLGKKLTSSAGVSALFSGEPGTGKTLAAQVIATELQLDLYRIDLSSVVSKYIGETEKNLEKIFTEAQNSNAILFFDEADAIFGKRSEVKDAHDRYANIEVGYLLQRMEAYDGVTVLATNLRTNIDEAFTRRLNFIVNFPFPEEEQRLKIWKVLLPPGLPIKSDVDWEFLARKYPLSGGSIRNVLVSAAFLAAKSGQVMDIHHILQAVRREMRKMGRVIKEEDYIWSVNSTTPLSY